MRVQKMFDLSCDPEIIYEKLQVMNKIKPDLCVLGTRLPGCFDPFEMSLRAVLGQQITVKAASTLASRLVEAYGIPIETGQEGLTHIFPSSEMLFGFGESVTNKLGELGVISSRSKTIFLLAQALVSKELDFDSNIDVEYELNKLKNIHGIGPWTANYIAMRAMGWTDVFLETDAGIKKAMTPCTSKELVEMSQAWRPWCSYATINIWNSL